MSSLLRGRYQVREAGGGRDLAAAQALRWRAFRPGEGPGRDADAFDDRCRHFLVEDRTAGGRLAGCWRLLPFASGSSIAQSYAAQFYDLGALSRYPGPMVEIGRFCTDPDLRDPDILRAAWGAVTAHVDANGIGLLFGCSSFAGTDPAPHLDAFARLNGRHLAPRRWMPRAKAPALIRFAGLPPGSPDPARAIRTLPPLLRTYLAMGGWVSDHAVIDSELGTLHVFTGVETAKVPPGRARILRALAS
ncbi:MAG: GNAT family N-acetyltransferase [Paracoccaceae bacterium]